MAFEWLKKKLGKELIPKGQTISEVSGENIHNTQIYGDVSNTVFNQNIIQSENIIIMSDEQYQKLSADRSETGLKLLNRYIEEKLGICKENILTYNILPVEEFLIQVFNYRLDGINKKNIQKIYFYKVLIMLLKNNLSEIQDCRDNLKDRYLEEADYLISLYTSPHEVVLEELNGFLDEAQTVILNILFINQYYENIHTLYNETEEKTSEYSLSYIYGLTCHNQGKYKEAGQILNRLAEQKENFRTAAFAVTSTVYGIVTEFYTGNKPSDTLEHCLERIRYLKNKYPDAPQDDILRLTFTEFKILMDVNPGEFMECYETLDADIQGSIDFLMLKGNYYEIQREFDQAQDVYLNLPWKENELILGHLLTCYLKEHKYQEILDHYAQALPEIQKKISVRRFCLPAMEYTQPEKYEQVLTELLEQAGDTLEDLEVIVIAADHSGRFFEEHILDKIKKVFEQIKKADNRSKLIFADILLSHQHGEMCLEILESIEGDFYTGKDLIGDFPRALDSYKKEDIQKIQTPVPKDDLWEALDIKAKIADFFIEHNIEKTSFLSQKANCLLLQRKNLSLIECTEQLFEESHSEPSAVNMLAFLTQEKPVQKEKLEKYMNVLKDSEDVNSLWALAEAYRVIEEPEKADFVAYRIFYLTDDGENYDLYRRYIQLHFRMSYEHRNLVTKIESVSGNKVVTLKKFSQEEGSDDGEIHKICLDIESCFEKTATENRSMGICHAGRRNLEYIRLQNKKIGDIVSIDNVQYTVQAITDRYVYAFQFAINRLQENPEQANFLTVEMESDNCNSAALVQNLEAALEEFRKRFGGESGNPVADLLEIYHFRNGDSGLPIDALCSRTYSDYIKIIRFLLYTEKQSLYAGEMHNDIPLLPEEKIVLTLPTLVLLGIFKALDLLESVKESIIIPESLVDFVLARIQSLDRQQAISPGELITVENKEVYMIPFDTSVREIWEEIYRVLQDFQAFFITNKERTELKIYEKTEIETLFSAANIDKCQMDCLILAQKNKAIYLSDDLFFRNLATHMRLKNVNLTWLIRYMGNLVRIQKIIKEIRETNYLTT